jgi:choloylglycine hydrolase
MLAGDGGLHRSSSQAAQVLSQRTSLHCRELSEYQARMEVPTMCLAFRLTAEDGAVIIGRSMEFGLDIQSNVIVVPRGQQLTGTAPGGGPGLNWRTKYAWIGANAFGVLAAVDGFNEAGLSCAALYFAGFADYQPVPAGQEHRAMGSWEFGGWALSNCASVAEVRAALDRVLVANTVQQQFGIVPPLHYVLHDLRGDCAVIEYVQGQRVVFDDPLTLLTNDPTFDWHLTNLRNYINLSANNRQPLDVAGLTLAPLSQGTGLLGLPGDWTSPSRFVRATALTQGVRQPADAAQGVNTALHLLNAFDIPRGVIRQDQPDGSVVDEITEWIVVKDLTNQILYFRTYDNLVLRRVDFRRLDTSGGPVRTISMAGDMDWALDVTREAR